ncbi:MAG: hypothetical protein ACI9YB_001516 [Halioglobus sp.]|jgi:hypothetical protein
MAELIEVTIPDNLWIVAPLTMWVSKSVSFKGVEHGLVYVALFLYFSIDSLRRFGKKMLPQSIAAYIAPSPMRTLNYPGIVSFEEIRRTVIGIESGRIRATGVERSQISNEYQRQFQERLQQLRNTPSFDPSQDFTWLSWRV